jgi:hypothetical protein
MCLFHAVMVCVVPGPWCERVIGRVRRKLDIRGAYWFLFLQFLVLLEKGEMGGKSKTAETDQEEREDGEGGMAQ